MFSRLRRRRPHAPDATPELPLPDVDRTGKTCQRHGHVVKDPGAIFGWCSRCEHSVHTYSGSVLYYGEFYDKVPPHDEEAEARTDEWARDYVTRSRRPEADRAALDRERRQAFGITDSTASRRRR
jgi:hypothetical protein